MTNERGEIRLCNLVATKAHSQFAVALDNLCKSLALYGHPQPSIIYTDNMLDKQFLEKSFPSLRNGVVPVDKYNHLESFAIPDNICIFVKNTVTSINDAMSTILDDLSETNDDQMVVVGFDTEWNVERSDMGRIIHRGGTAIVQIAYAERIYILQVCDFTFSLPHSQLTYDIRSQIW
jgi:hypothetical protein